MRSWLFAPVALLMVAAGCTPSIPGKDSFGTSALAPTTELAPEFAEFNAYDPRVNPLLADQLCATPYVPLAQTSLRAAPGGLIQSEGRCRTHIPFVGQ